MSVETKTKWPLAAAQMVARELWGVLAPACEAIEIAGSIRRRKPMIGDVEIVYVPRYDVAKLPDEMFAQAEQNMADLAIENLLLCGVLGKRTNVNGREMFGEKNKLVRHMATGMPVDLFATTEDAWFNYLVCRTGGSESNIAICNAAIARGWKWNPYGAGFSRGDETRRMKSEREVFEFVGLQYLEPEERT
jgi:DNA polymerase/3'-5' exonuclease PolX